MQKGLTVKTPLSRIDDLVQPRSSSLPRDPNAAPPHGPARPELVTKPDPQDERHVPAKSQLPEATVAHRRARGTLKDETHIEAEDASRRPRATPVPIRKLGPLIVIKRRTTLPDLSVGASIFYMLASVLVGVLAGYSPRLYETILLISAPARALWTAPWILNDAGLHA